jgi:hypothetical protein
MEKIIKSKTTLKGLVDEMNANLIAVFIIGIILYLPIANPDWFTSEDRWNPWQDFGPIVKWILIVGCSIALISLLSDFLETILYGHTRSLSINLNEGSLIITTSYKSFFRFSCEQSTIAHKLLSVNVSQGYFGKMYDTGTVKIKVSAYNNTQANEHEFSIDGVESPFNLKATIQEIVPVANDKLNIKES